MKQIAPMIATAKVSFISSPQATRDWSREHRQLTALWVGVMVVHVVSTGGLVIFCALYRYVGKPQMTYYASFLRPDDASNLSTFAYPFGILAAAHAIAAGRMTWASCVHRRLMFATLIPSPSHRIHVQPLIIAVHPHNRPTPPRRVTANIKQRASTIVNSATTAVGRASTQLAVSLNVTGEYFDHMHVLREAAEVLAQVVQAYWSSNYVSKLAINHALVAILVVNSWSTPLIHALMGLHRMQSVRDQLICRTICLLVDAFLNTSSAVVMPLLVLAPYWSEFNMDGFVFPLDDVYNDAFFAGLVTEAQMIATGKVSGLLLRLIPHLSVLSCCVAIQQFVVTTMSLPTDPVLSSSPTTKSHVHSEKPVWRTVVDFFFGVMGLGVLVIHTYTYARQSMWPADPLCPLVMAPWFASKHACAVYTFDCQHLQRTTPMSGDLAFLEESALIKLNFAHCPAMRMPPDIQRFNNMIGMTIKHLTLVEWSREAAVTPKHHPSLMYVGIGDVNLTEIPAGLLGTLPPLLQDIEITRTNLTTIPDELDRYWGNVVILYIEYSGVSTIPPSLMRLPLFDLSLIGNNITDASVLSGLSPGIGYVSLDHNPLIVMPKAFDAGSDVMVFEFCVESTLVRTVPPELLSSIQTLYMLDTPYCARATTVFTVVDCNASYFASAGKCYIP